MIKKHANTHAQACCSIEDHARPYLVCINPIPLGIHTRAVTQDVQTNRCNNVAARRHHDHYVTWLRAVPPRPPAHSVSFIPRFAALQDAQVCLYSDVPCLCSGSTLCDCCDVYVCMQSTCTTFFYVYAHVLAVWLPCKNRKAPRGGRSLHLRCTCGLIRVIFMRARMHAHANEYMHVHLNIYWYVHTI